MLRPLILKCKTGKNVLCHCMQQPCTFQATVGQKSREQFAVHDPDKPVNLKQGQGHQTQYELEDPKQVYNPAKFERPPSNIACQKANIRVFEI